MSDHAITVIEPDVMLTLDDEVLASAEEVFDRWNFSSPEREYAMGCPYNTRWHWSRGKPKLVTADTMASIEILLAMDPDHIQCIMGRETGTGARGRLLYPIETYYWFRKPQRRFGKKTALQVMRRDGLAGVKLVAENFIAERTDGGPLPNDGSPPRKWQRWI